MTYVLFACGLCLFLLAFAQLVMRDRQAVNNCMATASASLGYLLLYFWAAETGIILRLPALYSSYIPFMFIAIPAFYMASLSILNGGRRPRRGYAFHFILPAIYAAAFWAYNVVTAPAYLGARWTMPGYFEDPVLRLLNAAAFFAFSAAIVLDLLEARRLRREGKIRERRAFSKQVVFLFCYLAASLFLNASWILKDDRLLLLSTAAVGAIAVCFTLTCTAITFLSGKWSASPSVARDAPPTRNGSETGLGECLERLMRESAPYKDCDLSLPALALLLGVESKRLSSYFNSGLSMTFRSYINSLRLGAVGRELLENPDEPILEAAFANGFNSKTSFNTLFLKAYGMSPHEYRASRGAEPRTKRTTLS